MLSANSIDTRFTTVLVIILTAEDALSFSVQIFLNQKRLRLLALSTVLVQTKDPTVAKIPVGWWVCP